jgi:hypothetical protein
MDAVAAIISKMMAAMVRLQLNNLNNLNGFPRLRSLKNHLHWLAIQLMNKTKLHMHHKKEIFRRKRNLLSIEDNLMVISSYKMAAAIEEEVVVHIREVTSQLEEAEDKVEEEVATIRKDMITKMKSKRVALTLSSLRLAELRENSSKVVWMAQLRYTVKMKNTKSTAESLTTKKIKSE